MLWIKKFEMTVYCSWMTVYCNWVDILNMLKSEWMFDKIKILTILRHENDQNGYKQTGPYISA